MAPLTEPAFARLRSVDPVLAEAAGDAAFELETDLFAALAKGIMEKGASDAFPFAWASLAAQIGEVSPERVLEAGSALEAFGKKTANALLGAAKAVRSGKIGMERLAALPDDEAVGALCSLRCVDVRLAVRVLIGVLRRPDVLRFDDEAVRSLSLIHIWSMLTTKLYRMAARSTYLGAERSHSSRLPGRQLTPSRVPRRARRPESQPTGQR